ncbi:hypothetical protein V494_03729, partial [Pseudogymnoascus sp. VKM F-4513 (FW-928)]
MKLVKKRGRATPEKMVENGAVVAEPAAPEVREELNLPPKSFADAVVEGGDKDAGEVNGDGVKEGEGETVLPKSFAEVVVEGVEEGAEEAENEAKEAKKGEKKVNGHGKSDGEGKGGKKSDGEMNGEKKSKGETNGDKKDHTDERNGDKKGRKAQAENQTNDGGKSYASA